MTHKQVKDHLLRQLATADKVFPTIEAERLGVSYRTIHAVMIELRYAGMARFAGNYFGGKGRTTVAYPIFAAGRQLQMQESAKVTPAMADEEAARYSRMQSAFAGGMRAAY